MLFSSEDFLKIILAVLIGALIGWEREYRGKSAGLRTMILISVGSALFTLLSIKIGAIGHTPDRIASNLITGIGFLGAGVIIQEQNHVTGVTTASTIWMTAALGMAIGGGYYLLAVISTAIVLLVLLSLIGLQEKIDNSNQSRNYRIVCHYEQQTMMRYENLFKEHRLLVIRGQHTRAGDEITGNWIVQGAVKQHEEIIQILLKDGTIQEFDF